MLWIKQVKSLAFKESQAWDIRRKFFYTVQACKLMLNMRLIKTIFTENTSKASVKGYNKNFSIPLAANLYRFEAEILMIGPL